jgi:hypothetical protein
VLHENGEVAEVLSHAMHAPTIFLNNILYILKYQIASGST